MKEDIFDTKTFKFIKPSLNKARKAISNKWSQFKKELIADEIEYCLAPAINPITDIGCNSPMKKLVLLLVLQYVDSNSFGWRKKVIVCGYYSFDVMNEAEFRKMLIDSKQAEGLSEQELNCNIEKYINNANKNNDKNLELSQDDNNHNRSSPILSQSQSQSQTVEPMMEDGDDDAEDGDEDENKSGEHKDNDGDIEIDTNQTNIFNVINADSMQDKQSPEYQAKKKQFDDHNDKYDWEQPADIGLQHNIEQSLQNIENNIMNHKYDNFISEPDEEIDDDINIDDGYFKYKIVHRKSDLWRTANYHMYQWTKADGSKYRVFMKGKSTPNIIEVINKFVSEWRILSQAWDADNVESIKEYNIQKRKFDEANKKRLIVKWKWKPQLQTEFKTYWNINWTTDFGMFCFNI